MNHDTNSSSDTEATRAGQPTVRHDLAGSEHPSVTIVEAVAAATDRLATDLPPLQHSVESDALETLLQSESAAPFTATFAYADTMVSVTRNGSMEIRVAAAHRDDD